MITKNKTNIIIISKIFRFYLTQGMSSLLSIGMWMFRLAILGVTINAIAYFVLDTPNGGAATFVSKYNIDTAIIIFVFGTAFIHILLTLISWFVKHDFVKRYCRENKITKEEFFQKDLQEMLELWRADWEKND